MCSWNRFCYESDFSMSKAYFSTCDCHLTKKYDTNKQLQASFFVSTLFTDWPLEIRFYASLSACTSAWPHVWLLFCYASLGDRFQYLCVPHRPKQRNNNHSCLVTANKARVLPHIFCHIGHSQSTETLSTVFVLLLAKMSLMAFSIRGSWHSNKYKDIAMTSNTALKTLYYCCDQTGSNEIQHFSRKI